jgi:hypothetical protein
MHPAKKPGFSGVPSSRIRGWTAARPCNPLCAQGLSALRAIYTKVGYARSPKAETTGPVIVKKKLTLARQTARAFAFFPADTRPFC